MSLLVCWALIFPTMNNKHSFQLSSEKLLQELVQIVLYMQINIRLHGVSEISPRNNDP